MARGRRASRPRRARRGRGKVWDWIKGAAGKVNKFFKDTKLVSKIAPVVASAVPGVGGKIASMVGSAASQAGYGRRRRSRKGKMPAALAAYWAKKKAGTSATTGTGRRRRRRSSSRRGRGMPVSFGAVPTTTYPFQAPYARVRM